MCGLIDCPNIHKQDCGYDNPESKKSCPGYPGRVEEKIEPKKDQYDPKQTRGP